MTKDRVYAFTRKLQGMVKRTRELEANLDDGEGYKALIADIDPAKALEVASKLATVREQLDKYSEAVAVASKRDSIEKAEELLTDLAAGLSQAEDCYTEWRSAKMAYELAAASGEFEGDAQMRHAANERLNALNKRSAQALDIVGALVPSPGVIQL